MSKNHIFIETMIITFNTIYCLFQFISVSVWLQKQFILLIKIFSFIGKQLYNPDSNQNFNNISLNLIIINLPY